MKSKLHCICTQELESDPDCQFHGESMVAQLRQLRANAQWVVNTLEKLIDRELESHAEATNG